MPDWKSILTDLKQTGQIFTVYLRYMQKDTLAKIPNVRVNEAYEGFVRLENPAGYGILGYEDILYISIPRSSIRG